ncbi:sensor histidine kinase, partial [Streptomyces sp. SBT349]|uniref:sensor histidine kinase n=1 Tax=Streptomyces sp. SBT349 TaxID=1580539 RepID=UPI00066B7694
RELEIAVAEGRLEDEGWRIRRDGSRFWANVVITALFDGSGRLRGFGKVTHDLTERRSAEQAITKRRRLVAHLVEAQEMERRRIAWDVHDDSLQSMVAVGMRLQLLAGRLPPEHAAALHRLDATVGEAIGRLRNLIFRLRPPGIDRHGLRESLADYLDDAVTDRHLRYSFAYTLLSEPLPETAITIFRICQEALTNVHKHARATTVTLSLAPVDGGVLTHVTDDGIGLPRVAGAQDQARGQEHFGMIEMRERAETAGGWFRTRGTPGKGTTVEFWLPAGDRPPGPS